MKNKLFNAFLLLAMVGMMFTACKKEYPEPPIQDLPIGTVYTIDEILAMEPGTVFTDDASVYGIITADEVSGNLPHLPEGRHLCHVQQPAAVEQLRG